MYFFFSDCRFQHSHSAVYFQTNLVNTQTKPGIADWLWNSPSYLPFWDWLIDCFLQQPQIYANLSLIFLNTIHINVCIDLMINDLAGRAKQHHLGYRFKLILPDPLSFFGRSVNSIHFQKKQLLGLPTVCLNNTFL